ncbi:hypothetical protein LZT27_12575 [Aeromonas veronii]|uniref:hypothetical protein n=1 Tax=Aeromonas veronii TaxID=654 RepID=UPI002363D4FF|nr:hypothetical protein [Aeromonas veronii]MDD1845422.1 hypothetical protein [Aeromonas veronii]
MNIFNGADRSRSQIVRDTFLVPSLLFALFVYWCGLERYLNGLSNPLPMKFILCTSLFISAMYELKIGSFRADMVSLLATSIIFAVSPWLACEYRNWYLNFIDQLKGVQEATDAIGHEYIRAVENPAVGIGSCFAMALATIRLPLNRIIKASLERAFIVKNSDSVCPHCGQVTHHL